MSHRTETIDAIAIIKNKQYPGLIIFEEEKIVFEINGKRYATPFDWASAHCSVSVERISGDGILRKKRASYQMSDDYNHFFAFIDDMYDYESSVEWIHQLFKDNKKNALKKANDSLIEKERQEAEARRLEEERLEKEHREAEARHLEEERFEKERQEAEARRLEEERLEKERQEAEARRLEEERLEKERQEAEARRLEEERLEKERQEAEARRLEEERLEKERQEAEARRLEEERLEKERQEAEARHLEEERFEKERQEAEARSLEEERLERERQEVVDHSYMKTSNHEIQDNYEDGKSEILDKVEEIRRSKDLLDSFFSTSEMTVIHEEIIYSWINEEKRDSFVNYVALAIRSVPANTFEDSGIKRILDRIIEAATTEVNTITPIFCPSFDRTSFSPNTIRENKEQIYKSLKAICGLLGMKLDKNYEDYCKWIIRSNIDEYFNNKRTEEARQEKERQKAAVHRLEIEKEKLRQQEKERQEAEMRRIEEERLESKRQEAAAHPEKALVSDLIECIRELEQSVDELVYSFDNDSDIANIIDSIEDYIKDQQREYNVLKSEWLIDQDQKPSENKKTIEHKYATLFNNWHPYVGLFYPLACNESSVRFFFLRSYCKGKTGSIVSRMILSCISRKDYDRAELLFRIVNCSIDNAEDNHFDDRNNELLNSVSQMINQYIMEKPERITLFDYSGSDDFLISQLDSILDHIEKKGITEENIVKSIRDSELLIQNTNNPEYVVREPSEVSIDERIKNYENALKTDDRELEEKCQENPKYTIELIRRINKYYVKADHVHQIKESIRKINAHRLDNRVEYFINAYTEDEFLRDTLNKYTLYPAQTLGHYMSSVIVNHLDVHWSRISEFLSWCCFNITSEVESFVTELKQDERAYQIVKHRARKNTLEQVGSSLGVTRERVRQIEQRKIRSFVLWRKKNKPLLKIYADRNGDRILTIEEISEYFGEESDLMTYFLKAEDSTSVFFNKKTSTFVIGDEQMAEKAEKYVDSLPDLFDEESLEFYLTNGRYYYGLVQEITEKVILESYKKTGNKFHRSRLRRETIYGDVLRLYFPNGMHVYDEKEMGVFRKHVKKEYGLDINVSNHGLSAGISKIGLLCDRGTYKYNDGNYISESLAKRIENYVDNSKIPIFMTNTLFSVFEDELVVEGITNKYYLQGVLHELFGNKWIFRRDYISKDENITSISTSIIRIIEKSTGPVTKEDILRVFPGLTDVVINLAVNDDSIINLFGSYIHEKRIKLSKGDQDYLKKIVEKLLNPSGICHCKDIFEYIDADYHSLLANNYINYPFCMYSLLENIFRESYNFSRPFVSKKGVKIDKIRDIINEMVAESALVDLDEISAFAKEQHFVINGQLDFWDSFNSTHLILNDSQLVSILTAGIDTTKANQVEELILDEITGTTPISNLHCIKDFPEIKTDWTDWLIYSVLKKWGKNIEVAPSNAQFRQAFPLVAPKGKMNTEEYSGMNKEMIGEIATPDDLSNIEELIGSYILEDI